MGAPSAVPPQLAVGELLAGRSGGTARQPAAGRCRRQPLPRCSPAISCGRAAAGKRRGRTGAYLRLKALSVPIVEIEVDIVDDPVTPVPEAAYALLRKQMVAGQARVECVPVRLGAEREPDRAGLQGRSEGRRRQATSGLPVARRRAGRRARGLRDAEDHGTRGHARSPRLAVVIVELDHVTASAHTRGGNQPTPVKAATEQACDGACAEQARYGARPEAAAHRDLRADHRRGRHRWRSLDLVLPRGGRPGGEEQQELRHGKMKISRPRIGPNARPAGVWVTAAR